MERLIVMKKIGLFLNNELVVEYPNAPGSFIQAAEDCKEAIMETGVFHELKIFNDPTLNKSFYSETSITELAVILMDKNKVMPFESAWYSTYSALKYPFTEEEVLNHIEEIKEIKNEWDLINPRIRGKMPFTEFLEHMQNKEKGV
jgi:hypothetical protein